MPWVHHFVLIDNRGRKMYGTCLTVFKEFELAEESASSEEKEEVLEVAQKTWI